MVMRGHVRTTRSYAARDKVSSYGEIIVSSANKFLSA